MEIKRIGVMGCGVMASGIAGTCARAGYEVVARAVMYEAFKEPQYAPPPLLKRMLLAGHVGRKTGKGFYDYR